LPRCRDLTSDQRLLGAWRSKILIVVALGAVLGACSAAGSPGERRFGEDAPTTPIADDAGCVSCRLEVGVLARLGGSTDPTSISAAAPFGSLCSIAHLENGSFAVGAVVGGGRVALYDRGGAWLGSLGHPGEGPTEFRGQLSLAVLTGDTLVVLDGANQRVQLVTPAGRFVGSFRRPGAGSAFYAPGSGRLLVAPVPTGDVDQEPLFRIVDEHGSRLAAFGTRSKRLDGYDWWTAGGVGLTSGPPACGAT